MVVSRYLVVVAAVLFCSVSYSEESTEPVKIEPAEVSAKVKDCLMTGDRKINIYCLGKEYARVDAILNHNYKLTITALKRVDAEEPGRNAYHKLVTAQRAWVAFRDLDVMFAQNGDGHIAEMDVPSDYHEPSYDGAKLNFEIERLLSLISATYQRSNQIYTYITCESPLDMYCPVSVG